MRPDDGAAFRQALRSARDRLELPLAFGGPVREEVLHLTQHIGVRTRGLRGLPVLPSAGLGGHVLVSRRPLAVANYGSDTSITHEYDTPVLAEGIRSVVAVPVVVSGSVRGVLYGATRGPAPVGARAIDVMIDASRDLSKEFSLRDEVDRRLELLLASETAPHRSPYRGRVEELREVHAELRAIARAVHDDALRDRVLEASRRLSGLWATQPPETPSPLSARETDVLAQVALGCTNAETASRLSLRPETVKAYLRSVMRKLDARTRFEAVVTARRRGLLP